MSAETMNSPQHREPSISDAVRALAVRFGITRGLGGLVACGWTDDGANRLPWFFYSGGRRVEAYMLPDDKGRWRKLYEHARAAFPMKKGFRFSQAA